MNDEIKRITTILHRATQPACSHWAPIVKPVSEVADASNDELMPEPDEGRAAEPDVPPA